MSEIKPITEGIHHAGFTVPDLAATRSFFVDALGFSQVGEVADYPAVFLSDGTVMITLWQAIDPAKAVAFDRHQNIGLHHVAFKVADLEALYVLLKDHADVAIEFAPESLGGGTTHHLMCTVPGGIRVEFISPAAG
jgi:catechol 2,3-dioxygenase-like lactoylglutathione lyase family enzyme